MLQLFSKPFHYLRNKGAGVFLFSTFILLMLVVTLVVTPVMVQNRDLLLASRSSQILEAEGNNRNVMELAQVIMNRVEPLLGLADVASEDYVIGPFEFTIEGDSNQGVVEGYMSDAAGEEITSFTIDIRRAATSALAIPVAGDSGGSVSLQPGDTFLAITNRQDGVEVYHEYILSPQLFESLDSFALGTFGLKPSNTGGRLLEISIEGSGASRIVANTMDINEQRIRVKTPNASLVAQDFQFSRLYTDNSVPAEKMGVQLIEGPSAGSGVASNQLSQPSQTHNILPGTYAVVNTSEGLRLAHFPIDIPEKDLGNWENYGPVIYDNGLVYNNSADGAADEENWALRFDGSNKVTIRGNIEVDGNIRFMNMSQVNGVYPDIDLELIAGADGDLSSLSVNKGDLNIHGSVFGKGNLFAYAEGSEGLGNLYVDGESVLSSGSSEGLGLYADGNITFEPVGSGAGKALDYEPGDASAGNGGGGGVGGSLPFAHTIFDSMDNGYNGGNAGNTLDFFQKPVTLGENANPQYVRLLGETNDNSSNGHNTWANVTISELTGDSARNKGELFREVFDSAGLSGYADTFNANSISRGQSSGAYFQGTGDDSGNVNVRFPQLVNLIAITEVLKDYEFGNNPFPQGVTPSGQAEVVDYAWKLLHGAENYGNPLSDSEWNPIRRNGNKYLTGSNSFTEGSPDDLKTRYYNRALALVWEHEHSSSPYDGGNVGKFKQRFQGDSAQNLYVRAGWEGRVAPDGSDGSGGSDGPGGSDEDAYRHMRFKGFILGAKDVRFLLAKSGLYDLFFNGFIGSNGDVFFQGMNGGEMEFSQDWARLLANPSSLDYKTVFYW